MAAIMKLLVFTSFNYTEPAKKTATRAAQRGPMSESAADRRMGSAEFGAQASVEYRSKGSAEDSAKSSAEGIITTTTIAITNTKTQPQRRSRVSVAQMTW